jgi:uncharacterized damage-inducible protein DinB
MTETLAATLDKALNATLEVAQAFPDDKFDFWPAPNVRTVAEQIEHLAHNLEYVIAPIAATLGLSEPGPTQSEPIARLEQAVQRVRDVLGRVPNDGWMRSVEYPDGFSLSVLQGALAMLEHDAHHRGQLIVALRILEIEPPARWRAF